MIELPLEPWRRRDTVPEAQVINQFYNEYKFPDLKCKETGIFWRSLETSSNNFGYTSREKLRHQWKMMAVSADKHICADKMGCDSVRLGISEQEGPEGYLVWGFVSQPTGRI